MAQEKVLIVDDEVEFSDVLAERMRNREMEVDTAASGAEAIEKVKKKYYDAIILDMEMPGLSGMETLDQILSDNPDQQVIFLTGYASVPKSVEAIKKGATEFLEKPADIDKLIELVREAMIKKLDLFEKRMEKSIENLKRGKSW